jgi:hypothetical protein
MRPVTCILFIVIAFTVLAPVTVFAPLIMNDGRSYLGNLNVCHAATPAFSSSGEMPCVTPVSSSNAPNLSVSFTAPVHNIDVEFMLTSRSGRPPKS